MDTHKIAISYAGADGLQARQREGVHTVLDQFSSVSNTVEEPPTTGANAPDPAFSTEYKTPVASSPYQSHLSKSSLPPYGATAVFGHNTDSREKPTICGLRKRIFWLVFAIIAVIILLAAIIGGVVGGIQKSTSDTVSSASSHTAPPSSNSAQPINPVNSSPVTSSTPIATATIGGYHYIGCYTDDPARTLTASSKTENGDMTNTLCAEFCNGFEYFGTEFSYQCFCGNVIDNGNTYATNQSNCNYPCTAGPDICGGFWYISIWKNGPNSTMQSTTSLPASTSVPVIGNYHYIGCYTDDESRTLTANYKSDTNSMTNKACAEFCNGFEYFGTEYSSQCFCGNTIDNGNTYATNQSNCYYTCAGGSDICGGFWYISLWNTR